MIITEKQFTIEYYRWEIKNHIFLINEIFALENDYMDNLDDKADTLWTNFYVAGPFIVVWTRLYVFYLLWK